MKRETWIVINVLFLLLIVSSPQAYASEPLDTVRQFLHALQQGDVDLLQGYLGEPLRSRRENLLKNRVSYGNFLRKFYNGAEFTVEEIEFNDTTAGQEAAKTVRVVVQFTDGNQSVATLRVDKDASDTWKIVNEERDKYLR